MESGWNFIFLVINLLCLQGKLYQYWEIILFKFERDTRISRGKNNLITFQIDKWFDHFFPSPIFYSYLLFIFLRTSNQLHLFNRSLSKYSFFNGLYILCCRANTYVNDYLYPLSYDICYGEREREIPCTITLHVSSSSMDVQIRHVVHLRR